MAEAGYAAIGNTGCESLSRGCLVCEWKRQWYDGDFRWEDCESIGFEWYMGTKEASGWEMGLG